MDIKEAFDTNTPMCKNNRTVTVDDCSRFVCLSLYGTALVRKKTYNHSDIEVYVPSRYLTNITKSVIALFCKVSFAKGIITINDNTVTTDTWILI